MNKIEGNKLGINNVIYYICTVDERETNHLNVNQLVMNNSQKTFTAGQIVNYTNGNPTVQSGTVKEVRENGTYAIIIDETNPASLKLWNAGCAVGDYIHISQLV